MFFEKGAGVKRKSRHIIVVKDYISYTIHISIYALA